MPPIVLYSEMRYPDDAVEQEIYGSDVAVRWRNVEELKDLSAADCADVAGLARCAPP